MGDQRLIREWAKREGVQVGTRGRIPRPVVAQYERRVDRRKGSGATDVSPRGKSGFVKVWYNKPGVPGRLVAPSVTHNPNPQAGLGKLKELIGNVDAWTDELKAQVRTYLARHCEDWELASLGGFSGSTKVLDTVVIFQLQGKARRNELLRMVDYASPREILRRYQMLCEKVYFYEPVDVQWMYDSARYREWADSFFGKSIPDRIRIWAIYRQDITVPRRGRHFASDVVAQFEHDIDAGLEAWHAKVEPGGT